MVRGLYSRGLGSGDGGVEGLYVRGLFGADAGQGGGGGGSIGSPIYVGRVRRRRWVAAVLPVLLLLLVG